MMAKNGGSVSLLAVLLLVAANLLIPLAIVTFGQGFFPYKPLLPGLAEYADLGLGSPAPAPFDRVIFMVVDALRSDFVYAANSGFEYTQSLIRSGAAVPFTAHATSPTVTMPRIKAITTGSVPSFLDVVLNVDEGDKSSSLASQDTWLAQMKAKASGQLVLYGDDTWLKLFPDTFDRGEGTSSFFVADFTEVDNNVTRHVAGELRRDDWSVLVLHYLGLDHIGHKGGPRSPNMLPKQREMDGIVRDIYTALATQPHLASTLLVLCGDHGMNDAGNHGASSAGETSPALVFVSPALAEGGPRPGGQGLVSPLPERDDFRFYRFVEQSDVAPTLGALLGFPPPKNSLGVMMEDFLPLWPRSHDRVHILLQNARQVAGVLAAALGAEAFALHGADGKGNGHGVNCAPPLSDVEELACAWREIVKTVPEAEMAEAEWVARTVKWLRNAQETMSGMASNYDMPKLGLGLAAAAASLVLSVVAAVVLCVRIPDGAGLAELAPFVGINVAYGVMMFASSYVEEEHHFWYWATTAWLAATILRQMDGRAGGTFEAAATGRKGSIRDLLLGALAAAAFRLVRAWNQTGQKFAGEPDLAKTFLRPNPLLLWLLVGAAYGWTGRQLLRGFAGFPETAAVPGVTMLVVAALSFKLVFTLEDSPELVGSFAQPWADLLLRLTGGQALLMARARIVFSGLALAAAAIVYSAVTGRNRSPYQSPVETLLHVYTLLAVTQSRTTNIPLFLLFSGVYRFLESLVSPPPRRSALSVSEITTATLLLQYASFFALGGTNAISSVDLSSAYNGISGFSAAAVGVLLFLGNWAAPVYWALAAAVLLSRVVASPSAPPPYAQHVALLTVFAAASVGSVMAACTALRTHLFVWTVFSPKFLYSIAWALGMHLGVNVVLGGLLCWLPTAVPRKTMKT